MTDDPRVTVIRQFIWDDQDLGDQAASDALDSLAADAARAHWEFNERKVLRSYCDHVESDLAAAVARAEDAGALELELADTRLGAERQAQRAAMAETENERLRGNVAFCPREQKCEELRQTEDRLREATARYGSFLDWVIGYVSVAIEAEEPHTDVFAMTRAWMERLEQRVREARAALAAVEGTPP